MVITLKYGERFKSERGMRGLRISWQHIQFTAKLSATDEEAFLHFMKQHEPNDWDPQDII